MVGGSILATAFSSPFTTLVAILGGFGGSLVFLAISLVAFEFVTLALLYVAFVLVVPTFATKPTADGTPEVPLMVHCFPIFSVLLSFQLQHAPNAIIAIRGMTRLPLVIDKFTVEEWGHTCFGVSLIHGT